MKEAEINKPDTDDETEDGTGLEIEEDEDEYSAAGTDYFEDEDIPAENIPQEGVFDCGTTTEEIDLVAKVLRGNPLETYEVEQTELAVYKLSGTDVMEYFKSHVEGAEQRASEILNRIENRMANSYSGDGAGNDAENIELQRYLRINET
jgi:hypothetical protein